MTLSGATGTDDHLGMRPAKALLLRMDAYDVTQALPRAAQTLEDLGYEVTILAFDKTSCLSPEEYVGNWRVIRHLHTYKSGDKFSYLKAWGSWWKFVYDHLANNSYDLVQASNFESIVPCVASRSSREFPLVFDVRDLWGMSIPGADQGKAASKAAAGIFRKAERWAAKRVDAMVLNPASLDLVAQYFGPRVTKKVPIAQVVNVPLKDYGSEGAEPTGEPFRVNYSGHISYLRNAQAIMDFARANPDVQVDVVGKVDDEILRGELESVPNMTLYGLLPFADAMEVFGRADLIALTYDVSTKMAAIGTPNKLFEAMMMGRPYVASIGGYLAHVAESAQIGWAVPYGDAEALTELVRMLKERPDLVRRAGRRGRQLYEASFQWKDQRANLEALYDFVRYGSPSPALQQDGWQYIVGSTIESRAVAAEKERISVD